MHVADIEVSKPDSMGNKVVCLYSVNSPYYAIYKTKVRVLVHFADELERQADQRKAMAVLAPVRGQIDGLIDGWRSQSPTSANFHRAQRYDRRIADALVYALEKDVAGAQALLEDIRQSIFADRTGWARFQYLIGACCMGLVSILFTRIVVGFTVPSTDGLFLWNAAGAGALGAFFSIALGIRRRQVLTDLHKTANLMDAVLRVLIGVIGAAVLMAFVAMGAVKIEVGDATLDADADHRWLYVLVVGFIAGFLERLVPDLLAKVAADPSSATPPQAPSGPAATSDTTKSNGKTAGVDAAAAPTEPDDPLPQDATTDHCVCDMKLTDNEMTDDAALPSASGGVAAPDPK